MCLGIPAELVELLPGAMGRVVVDGTHEDIVSLSLTPDARPGEHLLLSVGFALERIDRADAQARAEALREIGIFPGRR